MNGNLLNSFTADVVGVLMRTGFFLTVLFTYPCILFPLRLSVEHLLLGIKRQFSSLEFKLCTLLIVACSFGVAVAVGSQVDIVFALTGAIGASLLCFVFPSLCYIKAFYSGGSSMYLLVVAGLIGLFGVCSLILGVISWTMVTFPAPGNSTNITTI